MKKSMVLIVTVFSLSCYSLFGQGSNSIEKKNTQSENVTKKISKDNNKAGNVSTEELSSLINKRRKLAMPMFLLRVKLIKEKPELKELSKTIMELHNKMTNMLDNDSQMKPLIKEASILDGQISKKVSKK